MRPRDATRERRNDGTEELPRKKRKETGDRRRSLSLHDLEVPDRDLLAPREEMILGERIQTRLQRLTSLLRRHPAGYRLLLGRLGDAAAGRRWVIAWGSDRPRLARDLDGARAAYSEARRRVRADPAGALEAYRRGVQVLARYPIEPELALEWSREVTGRRRRSSIDRLVGSRRIERLLDRTTACTCRDRDALALANVRLVLREALGYDARGMTRSDLFQEGYLGVQKAALRFDPARKLRFSTYATYWVKQAIRFTLGQRSRLIRVPERAQDHLRRHRSGRKTPLSETEAERIQRILSETVVFSSASGSESERGGRFESSLRAPPAPPPERPAPDLSRLLTDSLERLPSPRHQEIVARRFGLGGERRETLEEIGRSLHLSRERVRQIEIEALQRLRDARELEEVYEDVVATG